MSYEERNTWAGLIASVPAIVAYVVWMLVEGARTPVAEIVWVWPMLGTIVVGLVAAILIAIVWGKIAGARDPDLEHRADVRDREIAQRAERVGQAFLVIGGLVALVLCAVQAPWFWIAQALYAGFAVSAVISSLTRLALYRGGMP